VSNKRREKQERRRRRAEKRANQQAGRVDKTLECPNCGDRYRPDPQPEAFHRAGPCDCDAATLRAAEAFLDKREAEYAAAKNGRIPCKTCNTMHGEDKQETIFIEGRLIWDGCAHCVDSSSPHYGKLIAIYEAHRDRWFGPDRPRLAEEAKAHEKFVKPFLERKESIRDSSQIYGGSSPGFGPQV